MCPAKEGTAIRTWAPSSGSYQKHSETPRILENTIKRPEVSKIVDSWFTDIILFCTWILSSIWVRLVFIASHGNPTQLGVGTRRKSARVQDSFMVWSSPIFISFSCIKARWELVATALCSPKFISSRGAKTSLPSRSPQKSQAWLSVDWTRLPGCIWTGHRSQGNAIFWWSRPESYLHPEHGWRMGRGWYPSGK